MNKTAELRLGGSYAALK